MERPEKEVLHTPPAGAEGRVAALVQLGVVMSALGSGEPWPGHSCGISASEFGELETAIARAQIANGWATPEHVRYAFAAWGRALKRDAVLCWLNAYPTLGVPRDPIHTVGLILAGNVPLVGLHDVLCVWLAGHRARIKTSSQEPELIPALIRVLDHFDPGTAQRLVVVQGTLGTVDALIATGSNNTARYFEHYFGHLPRVVRKGRVSVAVLDGTETDAELDALGDDVFRYFGLGCRNVAKLYLPKDFNVDRLFTAFFRWKGIIDHNKYGNNYDYTRALWLLDQVPFLENGFFLLKADSELASPVSALFHETYMDRAELEAKLTEHAERIQCVVGHGHVPFGQSQEPALGDYADGVDTLRFLLGLPGDQGHHS